MHLRKDLSTEDKLQQIENSVLKWRNEQIPLDTKNLYLQAIDRLKTSFQLSGNTKERCIMIDQFYLLVLQIARKRLEMTKTEIIAKLNIVMQNELNLADLKEMVARLEKDVKLFTKCDRATFFFNAENDKALPLETHHSDAENKKQYSFLR